MSDTIYKIIQLTTTNRAVEVELVKKSELTYMNASKLNAPTSSFPAYYVDGNSGELVINIFPTTITSGTLDYIKKPADPIWAKNPSVTTHYEYYPAGSTDFELHPSEETDLVIKILALAGVVVKDPTVIQIAQQEEVNNFNQENA